jgi:hypothetical protein
MSDETVPITCDKCGYEWDYSGGLYHTTCPRCNHKTSTPLTPDEDEDADAPDGDLDALRERREELIGKLAEVQVRLADEDGTARRPEDDVVALVQEIAEQRQERQDEEPAEE